MEGATGNGYLASRGSPDQRLALTHLGRRVGRSRSTHSPLAERGKRAARLLRAARGQKQGWWQHHEMTHHGNCTFGRTDLRARRNRPPLQDQHDGAARRLSMPSLRQGGRELDAQRQDPVDGRAQAVGQGIGKKLAPALSTCAFPSSCAGSNGRPGGQRGTPCTISGALALAGLARRDTPRCLAPVRRHLPGLRHQKGSSCSSCDLRTFRKRVPFRADRFMRGVSRQNSQAGGLAWRACS
jgi:hypothetical protein